MYLVLGKEGFLFLTKIIVYGPQFLWYMVGCGTFLCCSFIDYYTFLLFIYYCGPPYHLFNNVETQLYLSMSGNTLKFLFSSVSLCLTLVYAIYCFILFCLIHIGMPFIIFNVWEYIKVYTIIFNYAKFVLLYSILPFIAFYYLF